MSGSPWESSTIGSSSHWAQTLQMGSTMLSQGLLYLETQSGTEVPHVPLSSGSPVTVPRVLWEPPTALQEEPKHPSLGDTFQWPLSFSWSRILPNLWFTSLQPELQHFLSCPPRDLLFTEPFRFQSWKHRALEWVKPECCPDFYNWCNLGQMQAALKSCLSHLCIVWT